MVKRIWKVSRRPGTEMVSVAKSHVSPKRAITPPILNIRRRTFPYPIVCFSLDAVPLTCRISTNMTEMKTIILKSMTRRTGPRNAPQKTPTWDRKQLQKRNVAVKSNLSSYYWLSPDILQLQALPMSVFNSPINQACL